jgi:hypothetical protein
MINYIVTRLFSSALLRLTPYSSDAFTKIWSGCSASDPTAAFWFVLRAQLTTVA